MTSTLLGPATFSHTPDPAVSPQPTGTIPPAVFLPAPEAAITPAAAILTPETPAPRGRRRRRQRRAGRTHGQLTCFIDETGIVGTPGFAVGVLTVTPHSRLAGAITELRTARGFTEQWHASAATGANFGAYTALAAVLADDDSWTFHLHTAEDSAPGPEGYVAALSDALAAAQPGGAVTVIADRYTTPAEFRFEHSLAGAAGTRGVHCTGITQAPSKTHDLLQVTDVLTYVTSDSAHRGVDRKAGGMKSRLVGALERRLEGRLAA